MKSSLPISAHFHIQPKGSTNPPCLILPVETLDFRSALFLKAFSLLKFTFSLFNFHNFCFLKTLVYRTLVNNALNASATSLIPGNLQGCFFKFNTLLRDFERIAGSKLTV